MFDGGACGPSRQQAARPWWARCWWRPAPLPGWLRPPARPRPVANLGRMAAISARASSTSSRSASTTSTSSGTTRTSRRTCRCMPNLLHFFEDNGTIPVEQPHAADRAHRRRPADHGHRPVRRPARRRDRQQLPDLQRRRHDRPGDRVHLLERRDRRHRHDPEPPATTPTRTWCTRRCRRPPANPPAKPDTVAPAPWVPFTRAGCNVGEIATVNQELENPSPDIPNVFGAELAGGAAARRRPGFVQGPGDRRLRRPGRALRQGQRVLRRRHRRSSSGRPPPRTRRWPTCCRTSRAATPASRRCSGTGTSRRSSAAAPDEPDPRRLPGHQRGGQPGRPEREPDQRRVPDQPPRLPRLRRHQRVAVAGLRGRHAGERRARWSTCTCPTSTATSSSPAWMARDSPATRRRTRSAAAARATSPRRSTTTRRSAPSSSGSPPTGSRPEEHAVRGQLRRG